jgi:hypothetical protein
VCGRWSCAWQQFLTAQAQGIEATLRVVASLPGTEAVRDDDAVDLVRDYLGVPATRPGGRPHTSCTRP